jgi:hypothetical protein
MEGKLENKFDVIYGGPITCDVPSVKESKREAIQMWGKKIGSQKPSFIPKLNDRIRVIRPRLDQRLLSSECVLSAKENRLLFSNALGLIILRSLDIIHNFIPVNSFVFGLDDSHRLHWAKDVGYQIPVLYKIGVGVYKYLVEPFNAHVDQDEILAFYETSSS